MKDETIRVPVLPEIMVMAREESGMDLDMAADEIGISTDTLTMMEEGKLQPTAIDVKNMAEAYGVDVLVFYLKEGTKSLDGRKRAANLLVQDEKDKAMNVIFTELFMKVVLADNRFIRVPLEHFPRLFYASRHDLENFQMVAGGSGIHFPDLNEDLSVRGLIQDYLRTDKTEIMHSLGKRRKEEFTSKQIADKMGVTIYDVSILEGACDDEVTVETLFRYLKACGFYFKIEKGEEN